MSIYLRPDGNHSSYPTTRDCAKGKKALRYDACEQCSNCADTENGCSLRYTNSDVCVLCARLDALDFFNNNYEDPKTPGDAVSRDLSFFVVESPCDRAGHLGVRTLDHRCLLCVNERNEKKNEARVAGRIAGDMFYTPKEPCESCGETAPCRVNNNSCRQCEINRGGGETASQRLMRENSIMVIDRPTARALGFKVYRTGKACQRGHSVFRYVSTGGCLECKL